MSFHARLLFALFSIGFPACIWGSPTGAQSSITVPVVVTETSEYHPLAALSNTERFPRGARLLLLRDGDAQPLVPEFVASADANVSFDGKSVVFAGRKLPADPWQIWELVFADRKLRKVTDTPTDAIRPLYLPGGRLVFALRQPAGSFAMVAADLDGSHALPLTYLPGSTIPSDVLADGRILFESNYPLGAGTTPELFLVYSDGSGVESYRCDHPQSPAQARWGGRQLLSGDIVFAHNRSLARFTSPLAEEAPVPAPHLEYAGGLAETGAGAWLISARTHPKAHYALRLWTPPASTPPAAGRLDRTRTAPPTVVLERPDADLVQPVLIAPRERPHRHPSALHEWNYANLLALDSRQTRNGAVSGTPQRVRLEARDDAGRPISVGEAPIEPDGSFFVKIRGDRPVRFSLLDDKGNVLRQEQGWFWARSGEQRICVGCHTGPERAADNRVPAVLLRSTQPVDLSTPPPSNTAHPAAQGSR